MRLVSKILMKIRAGMFESKGGFFIVAFVIRVVAGTSSPFR